MDNPTIDAMVGAIKKLAYKLFGGETSERVLAKRIKIFVLIGIVFIAISKLLYLRELMPFPNFELIVPTLVVIGSFSLYCGEKKSWKYLTRYFGVLAIVTVFIIDLVFWGFRPIYIFTWSGFVICWLIAMQNKLSMFNKFKKLLWRTTLTAAIAIIIFDIYTGVFGWSLVHGIGLAAAFLNQLPFTLYHLCSLIFIPPLVGLGKLMVKVKVPIQVAVAAQSRVGVNNRVERG
jgi:hypothetical protein